MLTIIAAHDANLVIGKEGALPWRISEDLKHFKKHTLGKPVLMGRKVFEEVGCKPLPGRRNIVLTSRSYDNVETFDSIKGALAVLKDEKEIMIAGGGEIYRQMIKDVDKMLITEVHSSNDGDTYFPEYRNEIGEKWQETEREDFEKFSFVTYERISQ